MPTLTTMPAGFLIEYPETQFMPTMLELANSWIRRREFGFTRAIPVPGARAFYKALLVCCNGDGVISAAEREWVIGNAAAIGTTDELIAELRTFDGKGSVSEVLSKDAHEAKHSRRAVVYEAIRACRADREYADGEKATVRRMAHQLGITDDVVDEIERLVVQSDELRAKVIRTLFTDGLPY